MIRGTHDFIWIAIRVEAVSAGFSGICAFRLARTYIDVANAEMTPVLPFRSYFLGPVVILLHGWPYDIYSFVDVTAILSSAGFR